MWHKRLWWWWLVVGGLATAGHSLLPYEGLAANVIYNIIGLLSCLLIPLAVRLHRPARPRMWYWFAAGQTTWVIGDLVWEYYKYILDQEPYPSAADFFYLCAYPMLVVGLVQLSRGRRRGVDLRGLVDPAIVAIGIGLVFWVFVMHPIAAGSTASTLERVIGVAYPAADALLLAILARFFTSSGARSTSAWLLSVAALLLLAADVSYSLLSLYSESDGGSLLESGWLLSYIWWAAAALHPSMRWTGTTASRPSDARVGRSRLVLLAVSSLLAPALLFVPGIGDNAVDRLVIAAGAVILFVLVVIRMAGFVSQVQHQADLLEDLAMADDLTGLANRRRLEQGLTEGLATGTMQVALLDLDDFKEVNDALGHAIGDRLLIAVAERLLRAAGPDALVARMGGDEFAVLLTGRTAAAVDATMARLAGTLHEPVRAGGHDLLVSASIGIADATGTDDAVEVLRRADVAMYAAKRSGGGACRRHTVELDDNADEQARLGAELRTALDAGQFRMVYQPIVELPHGRLRAVEALVRWDHPERGMISPDRFIPAAEHNGLIIELGEWILRTACAQAVEWLADWGTQAPSKISVNVSARQLAQPGFAAVVARTLAETGLPVDRLTVEVTETAVFGGGQAVQTLNELHELGVRIALDDFGTGHSSLGLLQQVPVDVLKVDKSFVDNITMAGRHAVIATALIRVSEGLGLSAVAEGVETAEQAAELYRLGYQLAQGYHFGKPVAEPDFAAHALTAHP
ncbi:putative bifunctional diguanylate cyclase/phosphodiesterase [Actinoplanes sp. NPDC049599]|uniref:putative bifunctional diguanylate cyclase/phosphodiesterase n=1 Tax=Actinoplanes sp. NPDC049599 TaxID=3363903 RepID=UPI00379BF7A7